MNKNILGRKIIDLIDENKIHVNENEEILDINISSIKSNPNQPRVNFDKTSLKQLAESIRQHGVIQPVIVKPSLDGYILVAGERRVRASLIAGKSTVPAIVRDYNSIYLTELAILENIQREDLTPIEEAIAYERVIKHLGLTQAELGKKIGRSRSYITNVIGLLNLPDAVIADISNGLISMGHAKILSKISDVNTIINLANKIVNEQITVRKLEELVKKKNTIKIKKTPILVRENLFMQSDMENYLTNVIGEKTEIDITKHYVRIKIKNEKHLKDIYNVIVGNIKNTSE